MIELLCCLLLLLVLRVVTDHDQMAIALYNLALVTHLFYG
jgi:type IV secretory pathway VirB3-like protein